MARIRITRRHFLGAAVATTAGAVLSACAQPAATPTPAPTRAPAATTAPATAAPKLWYDPKNLKETWWYINPDVPPKQGGTVYAITPGHGAAEGGYTFFGLGGSSLHVYHSQLLDLDPDGVTYTPDAASSWTISTDGKTYTFKLRNDMLFHDGQKVTSADCKFSMEILMHPDQANQYIGYTGWSTLIEGAEAFCKNQAKEVTGITTPDDFTLVIQIKEPRSNFIEGMCDLTIFPKHLLKDIPIKELKNSEQAIKKPIGSGPFKCTEFVTGQYAVAEAFDKYYGGRPYLDKIVWRFGVTEWIAALEKGEIQVGASGINSPTIYDRLKPNPDIKLIYGPVAGGMMLYPNHSRQWTKELRMRQALILALDRANLIKTYYGDLAIPVDLNMTNPKYISPNITKYAYDPAKAKQLIKDVGYDGTPLVFLNYYADDLSRRVFAAMIQMWQDVGVAIKLQVEETATFLDLYREKQAFDIVMGCCGWNDPSYFQNLTTERLWPLGGNTLRYKNPEFDKLVASGLIEPDPAKQLQIWQKCTEIMTSDLIYLPLFQPIRCVALRKEVASVGWRQLATPNPAWHPEKWYLTK